MGKIKRHGCRRGTDVHHGDEALQFVMSGFVEEVTERDHARSLTGEVRCKPRSTAAEQAGYRVQFPATAAEIVPGYDEVGGVEGSRCGKQKAILAIPEA